MNNKVHTAMKVSLFMANYGRELRMEGHKKKGEGRECDGVCRKNEKSA